MRAVITTGALLVVIVCGCEQRRQGNLDPYGKIYYLDGAGNLGFGQDTVPRAMRAAGFKGDVENIIWTTFTGPLGDQLIRANARLRADGLKNAIIRYRRAHSDSEVHVIGLSAGTGVSVWAVESLPAGMMVDNVVLLGSSLSSTYDLTKCLEHIKGKLYVLYSSRDAVLSGFIPMTGTIDGQYFTQPIGLVGVRMPARVSQRTAQLYRSKIVAVPWRPAFERYGYAGGHTDATSYSFLKYYIAQQLLRISPAGRRAATQSAPAVEAGE